MRKQHKCYHDRIGQTEGCTTCSLASYGKDCKNVVINPTCRHCGAELDRTFYRNQSGELMVRIPDTCFMGSCFVH